MRPGAILTLIALVVALALAGCGSDRSGAGAVERARALLESGKFGEAIIELKRGLQRDPADSQLRLLLADLYLGTGDGASAEKELNKAVELGVPRDSMLLRLGRAYLLQRENDRVLAEVRETDVSAPADKRDVGLLRGQAYLAKGEHDRAEAEFNSVLRQDAESGIALLGLARIERARGRFEAAQERLEQVLVKDPENRQAGLLRAQIELETDQLDAAQAGFQVLVDAFDGQPINDLSFAATIGLVRVHLAKNQRDAIRAPAERLAQALPSHPVALYLRALVAVFDTRYDAAEADLHLAVNSMPDFDPAYLLLGVINYARDHLEQANEYLSRFVAANPTDLQARKLLGATRLRLNRPEDALEALAPEHGSGTLDPELLAMIGQAAGRTAKLEVGEAHLRRAIDADPAAATALQQELARLYLRHGDTAAAIAQLEQAGTAGAPGSRSLKIFAYARNGDLDRARSEAAAWRADAPDDRDALLASAGIEMLAGAFDRARELLDALLQRDPRDAAALVNLGYLELAGNEHNRAARLFDQALAIDAASIDALLGHAQIAQRRGEIGQALDWIEQAREADPESLAPRRLLGRYYLNSGDPERAIAVLEEALAIAPDQGELVTLLGQGYLAAGRGKEALRAFEQAVALEPERAEAHYRLAMAQAELKRYDYALLSLRKSLELDPDMVAAKVALVSIQVDAGNVDEALRTANRVIDETPDDELGYGLAGEVYMQQQDYPSAQQVYRRGLDRVESVALAERLAQAFLFAGNGEQAVEVLESWLRNRPGDESARLVLGWTLLSMRDFQRAEAYFEKLHEANPDNAIVLNNLAWILLDTDRAAQALVYARRAYELAPNNPEIADTLGWVLVGLNQLEEGKALLQRAVLRGPSPSIRYRYAVALSRTGEVAAARETLERALAAGERFPERVEAEALLRSLL